MLPLASHDFEPHNTTQINWGSPPIVGLGSLTLSVKPMEVLVTQVEGAI